MFLINLQNLEFHALHVLLRNIFQFIVCFQYIIVHDVKYKQQYTKQNGITLLYTSTHKNEFIFSIFSIF